MSKLGLGATAAFSYLLWLVVFSPGWLVTSAMGPAWQWQQVEGSLWRGSVYQLQFSQLHLSQLDWQWRWPLNWQFQARGEHLEVSALASSDDGQTLLAKGRGAVQYKGEPGVALRFSRASFDRRGCVQVQGASWQLHGRLVQELSTFGWKKQGVLRCEAGRLVSETGAGELALSMKDGAFSISLAGRELPAQWLRPFYQ
ncbi:MAG: hypothetical protein ACPG4U_03590 [Pseudomonadales bacterium]